MFVETDIKGKDEYPHYVRTPTSDFWKPIILPVAKSVSYRTGLIGLLIHDRPELNSLV